MSRSILISGAGIAGPALAWWLLRFGWKPTLVERAPCLRTEGYIIDFWGRGYDVIERMGLLPDVAHAGYDVRELRLVGGSGERVGGFGASVFRELSGGRYTSLLRGDLSAVLNRAIEGKVEVRYDESICALDQDAHGVTAVFEHGGTQRYDAVIGADGLHSKVRELAFGPEAKFERYLGYIAAAFAVHGYRPRDEGVYVSYGAPGRQVARFAMRGDRTMFFFVVADHESSVFAPRNTDGYKAAYLWSHFGSSEWECAAILQALQTRPAIYFDRVSQIQVPQWSKGRIALLGDAAFAPSLLAGQGAALAITGAYVLAGELASAARPEDAFARYEQRLRGFIAGKQKSAHGVGRAFAPATYAGLRLRNLASRALNIRSISKLALSGSLRDDFSLPSYEGRQAPREAAASARADS